MTSMITPARRGHANTRRPEPGPPPHTKPFCTGMVLPAPSVGGSQNGVFCRVGIFRRMRAAGQDHAEMPSQPGGLPVWLPGAMTQAARPGTAAFELDRV